MTHNAETTRILEDLYVDALRCGKSEESSLACLAEFAGPYAKEAQELIPRIKAYYADLRGYAIKGTAKSQVKSFKWFEADQIPEINWVCSTLGLRAGPIHILNAFSNVGKTFFAASLSVCVANNVKLFDTIDIEKPGKVLHIDWDQGEEDTLIYYWKILNGYGIKSFDNIDFLFKPDWNLTSECAKSELVTLTQGYSMCVIDCLGAGIPGEDLNDDRVRKFIDMLNSVSSETKCAIMLLHHEPKNTESGKSKGRAKTKDVKGNGGIISAAGGSIHLKKNEASGEITLSLGKKRLTKEFSISYMLDDVGDYCPKLKNKSGLVLKSTGIPAAQQDLTGDSLPLTLLKVIAKEPGINLTNLRKSVKGGAEVDKAVSEMKDAGWVVIEGTNHKKHTITEAGKLELPSTSFGPTSFAETK